MPPPTDSPPRVANRFHFRPSPLAAAFTSVVVMVMFALGVFIISEYRSLQLQSHGKVGSVYIDNLLAPYARSYPSEVDDTGSQTEQIFRNLTEQNSPLVMRIWQTDGTLLHSTFPSDSAELHDSEDLNIALAGDFVAKLETSGVVDPNFPLAYPYIEVYAPIHDPETGELLAVGEIYQDASQILSDRAFVERAVWSAIVVATFGVLAMLALSFSQSAQLEDRLTIEHEITRQNDRLRRDAVKSRLDAAQSNEQVLNLVGAELHDGPVQLLGLMSLMRNSDAESELSDGTTLRSLIDQVMTDLRTMSAGLILPELEHLDASEVINLAVERHRALTNSEVDLQIEHFSFELDLAHRVCLYRVIQEGLTNAFRHSKGQAPNLTVRPIEGALEISIRSGPSQPTRVESDMPTWQLGLKGMRRRLEAFGGTLNLKNTADETKLEVILPVFPLDGAF